MKRIALILFFCAALAASAQTTITDTIRDGSSALWSGTITITGPPMTLAGGQTVAKTQRSITISSGALSTTLYPNVGSRAASGARNAYQVTYRSSAGASWSEWWIVPVSATPMTVAQVVTGGTPPYEPLTILPQQVSPAGAADADVLTYDAAVGYPRFKAPTGGGGINGATAPITYNGTTKIVECPTCRTSALAVPWDDLSSVPQFFPADDSITPLYYQVTSAPTFACSPGRDWAVSGATQEAWYCGGSPSSWVKLVAGEVTIAASAVTSGTFADARIAESNITQHNSAIAPAWANVSGKPTTFTPSTHTHAISDTTSLQSSLDAKEPTLPTKSGQAGKFLKVSSSETATEWATVTGSGSGAYWIHSGGVVNSTRTAGVSGWTSINGGALAGSQLWGTWFWPSGTAVVRRIQVTTSTAMPAGDGNPMTVQLENDQGLVSGVSFTIAASAAAGEYGWTGTHTLSSNRRYTLKFTNNNSATSASVYHVSFYIEVTP